MPFTFQQRVEAYTGTMDTGDLTDWLTAGARRIIDVIPAQKLYRFMKEEAVDQTNGLSVTHSRVLHVTQDNIYALPAPPEHMFSVSTAGSLHAASANGPRYYVKAGTLFVKPTGTTAKAYILPYPKDVMFSQDSIPNFPPEGEECVVLYAAVQGVNSQLRALNTEISSLTITIPSSPTPPVAPNPSVPVAPTFSATYTSPTLTLTNEYDKITNVTTGWMYADEDVEATQGQLAHIQTRIQDFAAQVQAETAEFNAALGKYSQDVNKYQAEIQAYTAQYQAYVAQVTSYNADVQAYATTVRAQTESYLAKVQGAQVRQAALGMTLQLLMKQYNDALKMFVGGLPSDNQANA